jgi:hypothetical protein
VIILDNVSPTMEASSSRLHGQHVAMMGVDNPVNFSPLSESPDLPDNPLMFDDHRTAIPTLTSPWEWQEIVITEAEGGGLDISGPTAENIAETLIALLRSHRSSDIFVPVTGVTCKQSPLRCFIDRWHNIEMYGTAIVYYLLLTDIFHQWIR